LEANTADGPYGLELEFDKGLFVLRVENTHGKSTCINSIAYALGMEMALGQQTSKPPFPASLLKSIEDGSGVERSVLSSFVMLEVSNDRSETVTLRRNILGADADSLIRVYDGELNSISGTGKSLYLHKEGDTSRELGFYSWLAGFMSWRLPNVPNNRGGETPLYPALLFPLFFVEQKKGWGAIQATTPFHFQVSQPKKRAFEFLMDLDVNEIVRRKAKNKKHLEETREQWKMLYGSFRDSAARIGGIVNGVEDSPNANFQSHKVDMSLKYGKKWQSLTTTLDGYREELKSHLAIENPAGAETDGTKISTKIRNTSKTLREKETEYESLRDEISNLRYQVDATEIRIGNLIDDKRKYEDLKKVKKFDSIKGLPILKNECPTCGREYSDHSLDLNCSDDLMTLDQSLEFIKNQISTFKAVQQSYRAQMDVKYLDLRNSEQKIEELSNEIVRSKAKLYSGRIDIDEEYLRQKIALENRIIELERSIVLVAQYRTDFDKKYADFRELVSLRKKLPEHGFSGDDGKKLKKLESKVVECLESFGFTSFDAKHIVISRENYLPTREGFDMGFDTSASDGIRVIWSYLISLFSLRDECKTNHPGLLIFDEPRQQEADKISFAGLLKGASKAAEAGQIIFATSEEETSLREALEGSEYSMKSFSSSEGKILRKL